MFAGEAYNVEMGITNQLFPQERDETSGCLFNATPEDTLNFTPTPATTGNSNTAVISDIEAFANFMRMLAPTQEQQEVIDFLRSLSTLAKRLLEGRGEDASEADSVDEPKML